MAGSLVSPLVNKLTSFLCGEVKLLSGVREEFRYVRDEFQRMSAFLSVAEPMEDTDPGLKVWIQQVRDVAYDTEIVLDKVKLYLPEHHGGGIHGFLTNASCSVRNLKARHQIASEIRSIRSRVCEIEEGHQRYSVNFNSLERGSSSRDFDSSSCHDPQEEALLIEDTQLVGIDEPKQQLIGLLLEEIPGLRSIAVVGMGGRGKTTLVKKVYDDAIVNGHFECHVWVTVSKTFQVKNLLKGMIKQLFDEIKEPIPFEVESMNGYNLKCELKKFLQPRRYVVILDDIWDNNAWDDIKHALPDKNCGSRVILTTRSSDIASSCCHETCGSIYPLNSLSPEDSWTLFCKKTFHSNSCPPHLEEISRKVLKRCEGLPLAIVAISGILATKDQNRLEDWEMIYRSLGEELEGNKKLGSMKKVLDLSYNDLPCRLKMCFLYMSIFPEDYEIGASGLKQHWIAEGFVNATEIKTSEEVADSYVNELVSRSLVEVPRRGDDGMPEYCRIHDMLREILVSKSRDQNMVTIVLGCNTSWPETVRRLSIHKNLENVKYRKCLSQIRSLFVFTTVNSSSISLWLSGLLRYGSRLLKVLDLEGAPLEVIPDEVFKLSHLICLNLNKTKVKKIPKLIGKLRNLETLYLEDTYVTKLPIEILKLLKLRELCVLRVLHEDASVQIYYGFRAPYEIGRLQFLQSLYMIEADQTCTDGVSIVKEVGKLTQLRYLGITKLRREDGNTLCSSIQKLTNLQVLLVSTSERENEILDLDPLSSPPRFLKRLRLAGRLEKLPHWIVLAHCLVDVRLRWNKLRDDPLQSLQYLPNLVSLLLDGAYEGEELDFKACGFQRLRYLSVTRLKRLRWLKMEEGTMPHLEFLKIWSCELMEELPFGIEHFSKLRTLDLGDMSSILTSKLNPNIEVSDCWKVTKIPTVMIWVWKDDCWRRKFT